MLEKRGLRLALAVLLTATVLTLIAISFVEDRRGVERLVGIVMEESDQGILILDGSEDLPAARAGIQPGDLLIAIDGDPVTVLADYDRHARLFRPGVATIFTVRRNSQVFDLEVFPGLEFQRGRFFLSRLAVPFFLFLALFVLSRRSDDLRSRLLLMFSAAVAIELALPDLPFSAVGLAAASGAIFLIISGIEMGVELHLASVIPEKQRWITARPWVIPVYYVLGFGFGLTSALSFATETFGVHLLPWSKGDVYWFHDNFMLPSWSVAVALLLAVQALRYPEPEGRHQAGLVLVGVLPWTLFTMVSLVVPSVLGAADWYYGPLQSVVMLFYPIAVFYAIFRYRLFDIELVVKRGLIYSILTVALLLLFFALVGAGGTVLSTVAGETSMVWVVSLATLSLGLLFSPLRGAVKRFIDLRFFPERYAVRQRLISLAEELPSLGKLPKMGEYLAVKLRNIFEVESVTLLIGDPKTGILTTLASTEADLDSRLERSLFLSPDDSAIEFLVKSGRPTPAGILRRIGSALAAQLDALGTTLVVPMATHRSLIGIVLFGERRRGERYPAEELELLSLLSHHVATTFENARLFESATYEGLTGLLRREPILERLKGELARAVRYQRPLTVGMADLDRFKDVNDQHGHLSGDAVLKRMAKTIAQGLRGSDAVGRYGGDEFLIVLPETDNQDGAAVAEKIREMVESASVRAEDGSVIRITVSVGLASVDQLDPDDRIEVSDLIALADTNLYTAKRAGRNRVETGVPATA